MSLLNQQLESLEDVAHSAFSEGHFYGTALMLQGDQVIFEKSQGWQDLGASVPISPDSIFPVASITKTFTSLLTLKLWEKGKFDLNQPLLSIFPESSSFWAERPPPEWAQRVTPYQCLTHTSGLICHSDAKEFYEGDMMKELSPSDLARLIFSLHQKFPEGTQYYYSNSGMNLMGRLIETVEKVPLSHVLQRRICEPLGLQNTLLPTRGSRQKPDLSPEKAQNYAYGWSLYDYFNPHGNHTLKPSADWTYSTAYAGWGLISTVGDLAKFMRALARGQLCTKETLKMMLTPHLQNYGCGINNVTQNGTQVFYHNGGFEGVSSTLRYYPEKEITLAILSSSNIDFGTLERRTMEEQAKFPNEDAETIQARFPLLQMMQDKFAIYHLAENLQHAIMK